MGNWRIVHIRGTIPAHYDLEAIRKCLNPSDPDDIWWDDGRTYFFASEDSGIYGLNNWVSGHTIDALGNIGKCYDAGMNEVVIAEMTHLLKHFPGIVLTIDLGDIYESNECVATFKVDGKTCVCGPPECATMDEIQPNFVAGVIDREKCVIS